MFWLFRVINKCLGKIGFELFRIPTIMNEGRFHKEGYQIVRPMATYSPWLQDKEFNKVYEAIKKNTKVDIYRCYELWELIFQCSKIPGAILEVGVWQGGTGGIICQRVKQDNLNKTVYLADTFQGVVKAGDRDSHYRGKEHCDTSVRTVEDLLSKRLNVSNYKIIKGVFPDESSKLIEDDCFSFCHIDVDVYQSAKDIADWIWPKLSLGGMVVYDDYGFSGCDGITKFVKEEMKKRDRLTVHNLNGHAIVTKIQP